MGWMIVSLCLMAAVPQDAREPGAERVEDRGGPEVADTLPAASGDVPLSTSLILEGATSGAAQGALQWVSVALEPDLGPKFAARVEYLAKWGHDGAVPFPSLQGLSSLDAEDFQGLGEAWVEWQRGRGIRLKAGWVDANTEFAASRVASAFANPSFGITPTLAFMPSYPAPQPSMNAFVSPFGRVEMGVGAYRGAEGDWSAVLQAAGGVPAMPPLRWKVGVATCSHIVEGHAGHSEPSAYLILDWVPASGMAGFVKVARAGLMRHVAVGLTSKLPASMKVNTGLAASMVSDAFGDEVVAEWFLAARVTGWLIVQPDVQVRLAPGDAPAAAGLLRLVVER